jgi:hypothetical protein
VVIGPGVGNPVHQTIAGLLPTRTPGSGIHAGAGIDAYANGRKTGHARWSNIMNRGLVFVPAESARP